MQDTSQYQFADIDIAKGHSRGWSYPNWPSHLDHILLSNELFSDFHHDSSVIEVLFLENALKGGFSEYDRNISDHRPVGIKLFTQDTITQSARAGSDFADWSNGSD